MLTISEDISPLSSLGLDACQLIAIEGIQVIRVQLLSAACYNHKSTSMEPESLFELAKFSAGTD
jgi:hypothetical protein